MDIGIEIIRGDFHWADSVVFGAFLVCSLAIGVYYGLIAKRKQNTAKEFLLGGEDMKVKIMNIVFIPGFVLN